MSVEWEPLSVRRGVREPFSLKDGVPPHIRTQLLPLIRNAIGGIPGLVLTIAAQLEVPIEPFGSDLPMSLSNAIRDDEDRILDVLDIYILFAKEDRTGLIHDKKLSAIESLLKGGHSVWTVNASEGRLEKRVSDDALTMYKAVQSTQGRPADRLSEAWGFVFGRHPDPSAAWLSCTKALEAALKPIVSPNNAGSTYGTILCDLRQKPSKWDADLRGDTAEGRTRAFIDLLEQVPFAPDRHEGDAPPPIRLDVARSVALVTTSILEILHQKGLRRVEL